ncbi:uncharacterized protein LOC127865666 [Dreissena polymorpha]|nr:uncharacterized protein LOC127865666 [Dreissena polymorpha]
MLTVIFCVYYVQRAYDDDDRHSVFSKHDHPMNLPLDTVTCATNFSLSGTLKENLEKIANLSFAGAQPYLENLGLISSPKKPSMQFPVIATAASSQFFLLSQGLVKSISDKIVPAFRDVKIIYYDIGLTSEDLLLLRRNCKRCEIRNFPFDRVPAHVSNLHTYAFKVIIINQLYQEFGYVWWVDSSIRFITDEFALPLKYVRENGILFFTYDGNVNVAYHTHLQTFKYFSEDPCVFKNIGEIEAGNLVFRKSNVADIVLRQWASCALVEGCISPANSKRFCERSADEMDDSLIGHCHRFDQSALSILLRRLFHKRNDYPLVEEPFKLVMVQRKHGIPYFV